MEVQVQLWGQPDRPAWNSNEMIRQTNDSWVCSQPSTFGLVGTQEENGHQSLSVGFNHPLPPSPHVPSSFSLSTRGLSSTLTTHAPRSPSLFPHDAYPTMPFPRNRVVDNVKGPSRPRRRNKCQVISFGLEHNPPRSPPRKPFPSPWF